MTVTQQRPQWVRRLSQFIGDDIIADEHGYPMDGSDDDVHDEIEAAVNAVLCRRYGHEIIDDMCGIPEHRYCIWCRRGEPAIAAEVCSQCDGVGSFDWEPYDGAPEGTRTP